MDMSHWLAHVRAQLDAGTLTHDECHVQEAEIPTAAYNDISVFHVDKRAAIAEQARRAVKKALEPPRAKELRAPQATES